MSKMRFLLSFGVVVLLLSSFCGQDDAPIVVPPPPGGSVYSGIYCVIRNPGQDEDSSCIPIEMTFTDQKVFYEYGPYGDDSLYCQVSTHFVLEEKLHFDAEAAIDNGQCDSSRIISGDFSIRMVRRHDLPDSLCLTKVDSSSGLLYEIRMVSEE
jgi:hypothetical protein